MSADEPPARGFKNRLPGPARSAAIERQVEDWIVDVLRDVALARENGEGAILAIGSERFELRDGRWTQIAI